MPMMLICMPPERYHGNCGRDGLEFDKFAAGSTTLLFDLTTAAVTRGVLLVVVVVMGGCMAMMMMLLVLLLLLLLRWATLNVINDLCHSTRNMKLIHSSQIIPNESAIVGQQAKNRPRLEKKGRCSSCS